MSEATGGRLDKFKAAAESVQFLICPVKQDHLESFFTYYQSGEDNRTCLITSHRSLSFEFLVFV